MPVFRVEKTEDYTVMSNYHFKEMNMSLKAKGLLSLILSLPNDWDYSIAGLVAICKENETAIKNALDELKKFGYLQIIKKMPDETKSGRIEYEYVIYEKKQEGKKQGVENLGVEILSLENQGQLNTKQLNTKQLNTYKYIVDLLNSQTSAKYKYTTPKTQSLIRARLKEGFTLEDFEKVICKMTRKWKGTEWEQYLRPETLFGTKFEGYLNENMEKRERYNTRGFDNVKNIEI